MKRGAKILVWIAAVLLVLLLAVTVTLKLYLTKERILAWAIPPLEQKLQRQVSIVDAGVGITGIHLEGLDVRAKGAKEPLVATRTLRIRWNLLALLAARLEMGEVRLVEPRIHVVRLPNGRLDIEDLLAPAEQSKNVSKPKAENKSELPVALAITLVSMDNGRISFEDRTQAPARTYVLDAINSRVTDLALDRAFPYELSARLPLAEAGRFSAAGTVNPLTRDVSARIRVANFDVSSLNALITGPTRIASGTFELDFNLQVDRGLQAGLKGSMGIAKLSLASGEQTGKPAEVDVEIDAGADLAKGAAVLRRCEIQAAGQKLTLEGALRGIKARPRLTFKAESQELQVDALAALLPPEGEKDQSEKPRTRPDRPQTQGKTASMPLDASGDVRVVKLLAGTLIVQNFSAHIELQRGVLTVQPAGGSIYGGTLEARLRAELEKPGPPFATALGLAGLQVGDFLAGLSPKLKGMMTGTFGLSLDARGLGGNVSALSSKLQAEAKDGKIVNHPLVSTLAELFQVKELETLNFYKLKAEAETDEGVGKIDSFVFDGPNLQATGKGSVGLVDRKLDFRLNVGMPKNLAERLIKDRAMLDSITDKEGWSRLPLRLAGDLENPAYGLDAAALTSEAAKVIGDKATKALEEKVLKKLPASDEDKQAIEKGLKKLLGK